MEIIMLIYSSNGNFSAHSNILHGREQYSEVTLDGFALILWGDGGLKIIMESSREGNEQSDLWSGQQDWMIVT
ncbi:hypothetical protein Tco_0503528 [Tanacetum coccineum]